MPGPDVLTKEIEEDVLLHKVVALDFETNNSFTPRDGKITGLGVGCNNKSYYFEWSPKVKEFLIKIVSDPERICCWHNFKFDSKWLISEGIEWKCKMACTMIMWYLLDERRFGKYALKGPDGAAKLFYGVDLVEYKDAIQGNLFTSYTFADYARNDVLYGKRLFDDKYLEIEEQGLKNVYWDFDCEVSAITGQMEEAGLYFDIPKLEEMAKKDLEELKQIEEASAKDLGFRIDLASPVQVSDIIFRHLKLAPLDGMELGKNGKYSCDDQTLDLLSIEYPDCNFLNIERNYRSVAKNYSSYTGKYLELARKGNGYVYSDFNLVRAETGRFSGGFQQFPRMDDEENPGIRKAICAPDGFLLVDMDLCLAEGTRVATERGDVKIENLSLSDVVIQEDGHTKKNIKCIKNVGTKEVKIITTETGDCIKATKEHRLRVIDENGNYIWRSVGDLKIGDYLALCSGWKKSLLESNIIFSADIEKDAIKNQNVNTKSIVFPKVLDKKFCSFIGYLLGDGCFHEGTRYISWVVCWDDEDVQDMIVNIFHEIFGDDVHICTLKYRGVFDNNVSRILIKKLFNDLYIKKYFVPEFIFQASEELVCAFLSGLFEADGSVNTSNGGRVSFCSCKKTFAFDVKYLLSSVGISSTLRAEKVGSGACKDKIYTGYYVNIHAAHTKKFEEKIGFLSERKKETLRNLIESIVKPSPTYGRIPNQAAKVKNLKTSKVVTKLLANTRNRGGNISRNIAKKIFDADIGVYKLLGLEKINEYGMFFARVTGVEEGGASACYDIQVEDTETFIANGFVSHNSQIELRLAAHVAKDKLLIQAYNENKDVHQLHADLWNCSRDDGKKIVFALLYGGHWFMLYHLLNKTRREKNLKQITQDEAQRFYKVYFETKKEIAQWQSDGRRRLHETLCSKTLFGRKRRFSKNELLDEKMEKHCLRQFLNHEIQGTAADIIKRAMIKCDKRFKELSKQSAEFGKVKLCLQVHDELLYRVPEGIAKDCLEIVKYEMENSVKGLRVPIKSSGGIGSTWADSKK